MPFITLCYHFVNNVQNTSVFVWIGSALDERTSNKLYGVKCWVHILNRSCGYRKWIKERGITHFTQLWGTTNSLMLVFKFAYVGEFTIRRRRVGVGEYARRRVDRIPFIVVERSNDITHVKLLPSLVAKISDICDVNVNRLSSIACCVILRTFCPN